MGAIPPSAILSRKGIARCGGGISHWAAKLLDAQIASDFKPNPRAQLKSQRFISAAISRLNLSRTHPSRDVIFSGQNLAQKMREISRP